MIVEPVLAIDEIQGNIIPGFKKDIQAFCFYKIADAALARRWLAELHPHISVASEVKLANRLFSRMRRRLGRDPTNIHFVWLNIAISATGLRALTRPDDVDAFDDSAFKNGMRAESGTLGDPAGSADSWIAGGKQTPVDLVLILASDNPTLLAAEEKSLDQAARGAGLVLVTAQHGHVREGDQAGHEHFGFKDGISEPAVRGLQSDTPGDYFSPRSIPQGTEFDEYRLDFAGPGRPLVWPGHYLFGYGRQQEADPRTVNNSDRPRGPAWAENGSFLVFRRLNQNVPAFHSFLEQTAVELRNSHPGASFDAARVGACLVGRWPSGTPLMRSPGSDLGIVGDAANYFQFEEAVPGPWPGDGYPLAPADDNGQVCPQAAHIRKVNPRDNTTDLGGPERTLPKLILRRGIPFGDSFDAAKPGSETDERGLLFACYQSSIDQQFNFLAQRWANQPNRPIQGVAAGHDPIIGQPREQRQFTLAVEDPSVQLDLPPSWVTASGGEYFFAPSIAFFRDVLPTF
jgi:Dyp-type peroxidase family